MNYDWYFNFFSKILSFVWKFKGFIKSGMFIRLRIVKIISQYQIWLKIVCKFALLEIEFKEINFIDNGEYEI